MDAGRRAGSGRSEEPGEGPRVWKEEGRLGHGAPGLRSRGRGTPSGSEGQADVESARGGLLGVARNSDRPNFREETWMESPKVASAAGGDASRRPAPRTKAMPARLGVPAPTRRAPGGRYLGGRLPSLYCPQVLVQLGAQLGQLSLQQDLGAGCAESWARGKVGGGEYTVAGAGLGESQA